MGRGWGTCRHTFALLPHPPISPHPSPLSLPLQTRTARRAERVRPVCRSLSLLRAPLGPPVPLMGARRSVRPGACRLPRAGQTLARRSEAPPGPRVLLVARRGVRPCRVRPAAWPGLARVGAPGRGPREALRPTDRIRAKICAHTQIYARVRSLILALSTADTARSESPAGHRPLRSGAADAACCADLAPGSDLDSVRSRSGLS